jgi:LPXTG-motif cell wall-anchored protein
VGPFTANVEFAGPFRFEGKPYTIAATQAFAGGQEPATSRTAAAIAVAGIVALAAAGLVIYKKKLAA